MVNKGNDTGFFRNVRKSSHEHLYDKRAEGDKAATKIVWVVEDKSATDAREWQLVVDLDMVLPPWLSEIANVTDRESATTLYLPGICFALKNMFFDKHTNTKRRSRCMRYFSLLDCLLITSTTAILSNINKIFLFAISEPQISKAKTIGKNSFTAICKGRRVCVHSSANHFDPNTAANPNKPEASVKSRVTSEDSYSSGRRTDFPLKF